MKILLLRIKENFRSIAQILLLFILIALPSIVDASGLIEGIFQSSKVDFENMKYFFLLRIGNIGIGIVLMLLILFKIIRNSNKDKLFNTENVYHNYPYWWYWVCAKILGYEKCNLKRVPIYLQFKLIINDTFPEYVVGTVEDYPIIENEQVEVSKKNWNKRAKEINLVLSDTYPIKKTKLPIMKSGLPTLVINRKRSDYARYYNPQFVVRTVDEVRKLPANMTTLNLFAATNAKHTKQIAEDAFKMAERGNIKKLVVFQASEKDKWKFEKKGKVIYKF